MLGGQGRRKVSWFVAGDDGAFIRETNTGVCSSPMDGRERPKEVDPLLGKLRSSGCHLTNLNFLLFWSPPARVLRLLCWSVVPSTSSFPPVPTPLAVTSQYVLLGLSQVSSSSPFLRSCACPVTWLLQPLLPGHLAHSGAIPVHSLN